jgi:hypothetical protein
MGLSPIQRFLANGLKIHCYGIKCEQGRAIELKTVRLRAKTTSAAERKYVAEIHVFWEITA